MNSSTWNLKSGSGSDPDLYKKKLKCGPGSVPISGDRLVGADMDIQKCGRKRAYFLMEKKKCAKADEKLILSKFILRQKIPTELADQLNQYRVALQLH